MDLKVLALVYDLEKQFKGTDHINKDPPTKVLIYSFIYKGKVDTK